MEKITTLKMQIHFLKRLNSFYLVLLILLRIVVGQAGIEPATKGL
jgi:hypothetical protein